MKDLVDGFQLRGALVAQSYIWLRLNNNWTDLRTQNGHKLKESNKCSCAICLFFLVRTTWRKGLILSELDAIAQFMQVFLHLLSWFQSKWWRTKPTVLVLHEKKAVLKLSQSEKRRPQQSETVEHIYQMNNAEASLCRYIKLTVYVPVYIHASCKTYPLTELYPCSFVKKKHKTCVNMAFKYQKLKIWRTKSTVEMNQIFYSQLLNTDAHQLSTTQTNHNEWHAHKLIKSNSRHRETNSREPATRNVNTISSVWQELCRSGMLIVAIFTAISSIWLQQHSQRCTCPQIIINIILYLRASPGLK